MFVFALCFILILKGSDLLISSAIWIAEITRIPTMVIGATIVSISTTLPETIISVMATLNGHSGFAVSNSLGAMISNISLILGFSFLIAPTIINRRQLIQRSLFLFLCLFLFFIFAIDGKITIGEGFFLLGSFVLFIVINIFDSLSEKETTRKITSNKNIVTGVLEFIVGAFAIGFGASMMVRNVSSLSVSIGLNEEVVGLTFMAVGTNLPELVTTLTSIRKGSPGIGIGNIIGANILNTTLLMGMCVSFSGTLIVDVSSFLVSFITLSILTCIALLPCFTEGKTYRLQGVALIAIYIIYCIILIF